MPLPVSTYRLQFRGGMDFDRAIGLVPYLKRLGVSHLYTSPLFAATKGSTHGYDVTDANLIDPVLGGREGLERLVAALKAAGLGLILDIVPNHMAASLENPWWRSVIEWGEESRYSHYFDIDWSQALTLPFLGKPFDQAVADGEISIAFDPAHGALALAYFESLYPLNPASYSEVLKGLQSPIAARLSEAVERSDAADEASFHEAVRKLCREADWEGLIEELNSLSGRTQLLSSLHERQTWRLMSWAEAAEGLSYRRFFEIAGLVGLRVEAEDVFEASHRTVLELVQTGQVDGLRIDHVDGLADPAGYLRQLRDAVGPDISIHVEKILAPGEHLPKDWPVEGTTGYEFIAAKVPVLLDQAGFLAMRQAYHDVAGPQATIPDKMREAKLRMIRVNFAGEVKALTSLGAELLALEQDTMTRALEELLLAFPRYRTYGAQGKMSVEDRQLLDEVLENAKSRLDETAADAAWSITDLLKGDGRLWGDGAVADIFRRRFQQLTGPLMAKSLEDTLFFRHTEFLAMNEVGGELEPEAGGLDRFHAEMQTRAQIQPSGLSASSTHDTKRGEDARARLFALAEDAPRFARLIEGWRQAHAGAVVEIEGRFAPEPEVEWMIFQALIGHWPVDLAADDREGIADFAERVCAFVEKSLREAKLRTDWNDVNAAYETAATDYVRKLLLDDHDFVAEFVQEIQPLIWAGLINGLTQSVIKISAPGVPDVYQGSEAIDLSFVDPDNRRSPPFEALSAFDPHAPLSFADERALAEGWLKQAVIARGLALRQRHPDLFLHGDYTPLTISGPRQPQAVAFAREKDGAAAITIACRLPTAMMRAGEGLTSAQFWGNTAVDLPPALSSQRWTDALSGQRFANGDRLLLRNLLDGQTVALLVSDAP
ncbi:malto-oligosyltrehalose synthase [Rhizobium sp. AQ_MP]|uniref:malto-oligosyltrehalose synthase n=1 Tax=Rhizobium sp. AQ_MP TaxID=2761536 RepID=UPI00163AB495|nr:malto-oligosyltrehalose synthase [Rhizobium sp. AQ_MP]MBC2772048.1 malto-oligosyltrehalose synthase [Rhizobium sp. AQ_MP]